MKQSWSDHLSDSNLPADEFTWTEGSNYGLDGFSFDQTLTQGLRDKGNLSMLSGPITNSQVAGMSDLPDEIFSQEIEDSWEDVSLQDDDGLSLGAMLSDEEGTQQLSSREKKALSLVDLAWLDPTQEQDPERLPAAWKQGQPPLDVSPELEEAWGVERRTNGLRLVPNRDKEIADYEKSIESGLPATPGVEKSAHEVSWHIQKAFRMSHYGEPLEAIHRHLKAHLSPGAAGKAYSRIASTHGLAGRVFVQASAFPGLKNGKWVDVLKRVARSARYVITDDHLVASKLGMTMVASVPWGKALRHYKPLLQATGYRLASGDPKSVLQQAFLQGPQTVVREAEVKPVETRPADSVSAKEAFRQLKSAPKKARQVIVKDDTAKARKMALEVVAKAAKAGLITASEALRLRESTAAPVAIRQAAQALAAAHQVRKASTYDGEGAHFQAYRKAQDRVMVKLAQAELLASQMKRAHGYVMKMARAGQITDREAKRALLETTPEMVLKVATAFANSSGTRSEQVPASKQASSYSGPKFEAAPVRVAAQRDFTAAEKAMHMASKSSGIRVDEFKHMASWLRQQMSEGMAGKDLTDLVRHRFASPLRKAGEDMVRVLRAEHEGLSGHLYVDAEAYASKVGTKGCEEGALKHRANGIQYVKAMPRCAGCVFANANSFCTKYGKDLLEKLPKSAKQFQKQMIAQADALDHENTAALFRPNEFRLSSDVHVEVDGPAVTEDIGDVFFGGMLV